MITSKVTKNDQELLVSIGNYQALTVKQLSILSQRSSPVLRRRIRALIEEELIVIKMHGYGRDRGRPENLILLTEKGATLLRAEGIISCQTGDKAVNFLSIDHLLLVNWFRIHLVHIERIIPQLSINWPGPNPDSSPWNIGDHPSLSVSTSGRKRFQKTGEFIPDGIFSIANREEKKALLFFLEVDMGTETIASVDRNHKDIRQKVLNYQALFKSGHYKRLEHLFDSTFNGFRLLFLANSPARLKSLCGLVREMPSSDFIWLVDQEKMFSQGLSAKIWARGGRSEESPQSILGPGLARELPLVDISGSPLGIE